MNGISSNDLISYIMDEMDLMIGDSLFGVINYNWQVNGNYHIGEAIEQLKQHNKSNLLQFISYDDAIESLARALMLELPSTGDKGSRIGAIATNMFVFAHGYQPFARGRSVHDIFMDIFKYIFQRV